MKWGPACSYWNSKWPFAALISTTQRVFPPKGLILALTRHFSKWCSPKATVSQTRIARVVSLESHILGAGKVEYISLKTAAFGVITKSTRGLTVPRRESWDSKLYIALEGVVSELPNSFSSSSFFFFFLMRKDGFFLVNYTPYSFSSTWDFF